MKKLFPILFSFLLFSSLFYTQQANAQAPNKMNYQAIIRNAAGILVKNSSVGIKISVIQGSSNGSTIYSETHSTTTNINGLANIEIGGGIPVVGTLSSIAWANGPYFLKTETDPLGGTNYLITGTDQLLSVP